MGVDELGGEKDALNCVCRAVDKLKQVEELMRSRVTGTLSLRQVPGDGFQGSSAHSPGD